MAEMKGMDALCLHILYECMIISNRPHGGFINNPIMGMTMADSLHKHPLM